MKKIALAVMMISPSVLALAAPSKPTLSKPKEPLLFACSFAHVAPKGHSQPKTSASFVLLLEPTIAGPQRFRINDPNNLMIDQDITNIDEFNDQDVQFNEFWIGTVKLPMDVDDARFAVYPGNKAKPGDRELRGADIGRLPDLSEGLCFVHRGAKALEVSKQLWPEEAP